MFYCVIVGLEVLFEGELIKGMEKEEFFYFLTLKNFKSFSSKTLKKIHGKFKIFWDFPGIFLTPFLLTIPGRIFTIIFQENF